MLHDTEGPGTSSCSGRLRLKGEDLLVQPYNRQFGLTWASRLSSLLVLVRAQVSLDYLTELHEMHEQWLRRPDSVYGSKQVCI